MTKTDRLIAVAVKNNLWCKNVGPWTNDSGEIVPNKWEKCDKSDPESQPDLNSAAELLHS